MVVEGNLPGLKEHGRRDVDFQERFTKGSDVQSDSVFCFFWRGCCVIGGGFNVSLLVYRHSILVVEEATIDSIGKRLANPEKLKCPADNRLYEVVESHALLSLVRS